MSMRSGIRWGVLLFFAIGHFSCSRYDKTDTPQTTFIDRLPDSVRNGILWYCDYEDNSFYKWEGEGTETPFAGGGIFITDEQNAMYGIEQSFSFSGFKCAYATIMNALVPTQKKAVRFMRWTNKPWDQGGDYFPEAAYYSTFFLMEHPYDPKKDPQNDPEHDGGWWNVFQFKSKNNAGSLPIVSLDVYNSSGNMYLGLVIKDYPDDDSDSYTQEYITRENPIAIRIHEWNHIEMYYEKSKSYTGRVAVWLNQMALFEKDGIRTVLPSDETAVWGIGNYTDYITGGPVPGTATIYFDDAVVSAIRISDYIHR